jgi:hypothetical protein
MLIPSVITMINVRHISLLVLLFTWSTVAHAQDTKDIRGQVVDKDSKYPIIGANITVVNSDPLIGAKTDVNGYFILPNVPLGRVTIRASYIGYKDAYANDILVIVGRENQLNIELEEKVSEIKEITVTDKKTEQGAAKNEFAAVSARSFDVEETSKFSGSRNDPARMASNFAGVSGANDARNDIIIRGNSPTGLLWRLDGLDIPSPNHFASFGSSGGPVSMLNNNTLARSDFFTAAWPAEYGDALSGVFDLKMRSGNKDRYEFLGQIGFNGIEVGAEGPFAKNKSNATFLINYRYSTLGLFKLLGANTFLAGGAVPMYQDLSFKIDVPTKKAGIFRLFGLGGLSSIALLGSEAEGSGSNLYGNENENLFNKVQTGIMGFSHTYFLTPKSYIRTTLGVSHQRQQASIDTIGIINRTDVVPYERVSLRQNKYTAHIVYNNKLDAKNTIMGGIISNVYDVKFSDSISLDNVFKPRIAGSGYSDLLEGYLTWQHKFGDRLVLNIGAHSQYFTLSNSAAIEPRIGARYQLTPTQFLSIGYGLHDELQPLPTYYNYDTSSAGNGKPTNLHMGFSRSNHLVLGHEATFKGGFHIKTEIYFQYLDKIPVDPFSSSFSMLNAGADFSSPGNPYLVNKGVGRNYGLELTLEKFYSKGYYFLITGSLFQSEYKGSDGIWRNTAFNGHYVANALGGYEYKFGGKKKKVKRNTIALDGKFTVAGGRYYTPIDVVQSAAQGQEVLLNDQAFSQEYPLYLRLDLKLSYRISLDKITHEFSIDCQNVTNRQNVFIKTYDIRTNSLVTQYQQGIFPLPQYRILF